MSFDDNRITAQTLVHWPTTGTITIFDTEFTAWEGSQARNWSEPWEFIELVEIGAVRTDAATFTVQDTFQVLVHPKKNPVLSAYFTDLTGITQADLDARGQTLPQAVTLFEAFVANSDTVLSNGGDADVFNQSFACHELDCPMDFSLYWNIQPALLKLFPGNRSISSATLPELAGAEFVFKAHEALEDALAIAAALKHLRADGRI